MLAPLIAVNVLLMLASIACGLALLVADAARLTWHHAFSDPAWRLRWLLSRRRARRPAAAAAAPAAPAAPAPPPPPRRPRAPAPRRPPRPRPLLPRCPRLVAALGLPLVFTAALALAVLPFALFSSPHSFFLRWGFSTSTSTSNQDASANYNGGGGGDGDGDVATVFRNQAVFNLTDGTYRHAGHALWAAIAVRITTWRHFREGGVNSVAAAATAVALLCAALSGAQAAGRGATAGAAAAAAAAAGV